MATARIRHGEGEWTDVPMSASARAEFAEEDPFAEHCPCAATPSPSAFTSTAPPVDATFVWIYWHGGAKADELRWSIRSVIANYRGKASIVVVGDPPPWYSGQAIRMPRVGPGPLRRYRDQLTKFVAVCDSPLIPETFVWMMDDTVFLRSIGLADIAKPTYFGSVPARVHGSGEWNDHKRATFAQLRALGLPEIDFCTHMPHVIEKSKFMETWRRHRLDTQTLQWEILYGADHWRGKHERIDARVFKYIRQHDGAPSAAIMNHSERSWSAALHGFLLRRFPRPAACEQAALKPMRVEPRMRDGLKAFIEALPGEGLSMAEIGSYAGESSEIFAQSGKFSAIHCVDSWNTFAGKSHRTSEAEPFFDVAAARWPVIHKYKSSSSAAAREFADGTLDLVYIDAAHDFANVRADIAAWQGKVKRGGWLGGHDYCLKTPGVIEAVREAFPTRTIRLFGDDSWLLEI